MKLCKDCRHFAGYSTRECRLSAITGEKTDMVTGEVTHKLAMDRRKHGVCGVDAKYFDPKPQSWFARLTGAA